VARQDLRDTEMDVTFFPMLVLEPVPNCKKNCGLTVLSYITYGQATKRFLAGTCNAVSSLHGNQAIILAQSNLRRVRR